MSIFRLSCLRGPTPQARVLAAAPELRPGGLVARPEPPRGLPRCDPDPEHFLGECRPHAARSARAQTPVVPRPRRSLRRATRAAPATIRHLPRQGETNPRVPRPPRPGVRRQRGADVRAEPG